MNNRQLREFCNKAADLMWESASDGGDIFRLEIIERFIKSKGYVFDSYPPEFISKFCYRLEKEHRGEYEKQYKQFVETVSEDLFDYIKEEAERD